MGEMRHEIEKLERKEITITETRKKNSSDEKIP